MGPRHLSRLASIVILVVLASCAWGWLAHVIGQRTDRASRQLDGTVEVLWGGPQTQAGPLVSLLRSGPVAAGPPFPAWRAVPLVASELEARLEYEPRRRGLLWYSTYKVGFEGRYAFVNESEVPAEATIAFALPAAPGAYDDFLLHLRGRRVETLEQGGELGAGRIGTRLTCAPGERVEFRVSYRAQGLDEWRYALEASPQVRDFRLRVVTDFSGHDFPARTMSPTSAAPREDGPGHRLEWKYSNLLGGRDIAVRLPQRRNPGPLAAAMARFAPVSLVFFLGVLFFLYLLRGIPLHPVHYAFLSAAFFAFHLLFAHLVDHLALAPSFAIASVVSVVLVVSYLRLVVNPSFAFFQAGSLQLLYLVLFSFAHFFEGWTGLTVTSGAIVTLFVVMQLTARVDWERVFAEPGAQPAGSSRVPLASTTTPPGLT